MCFNKDKIASGVFWILAVVSLFAFTTNPLSMSPKIDSSVFYYMGSGMRAGFLPYRDMFDHKGLLIYVFNGLGALLGLNIIGVWVVESVLYLSHLIFLFRCVRTWSSPPTALGVCVVYICCFFLWACGGNMTETYAVYFILPTWLLLMEDILRERLRKRTVYMAGLASGAILMLRPNMFAICLPVGCYMVEHCLGKRSVRLFIAHSALVLLGMATLVAPLLGYAAYHGILGDLYDCYIRFNMTYASGLKPEIHGSLLILLVVAALNLLQVFMVRNRWRKVLVYNLIFSAASLLLILMKLKYPHYFLPFVPCMVVPLIALFECPALPRCISALFGCLVGAYWLIYMLVAANLDLHEVKMSVKAHRVPELRLIRNRNSEVLALKSSLPAGSSVLALGNYCEGYRLLDVRTNCKYFYQTVSTFSPEIERSVLDFIERQGDRYVLMYDKEDGPLNAAVKKHYRCVNRTENWGLWEALCHE